MGSWCWLSGSASTYRYYRMKAEQVLDIAIAPGNSPIRLHRGCIKVCQLFADLQRHLDLGEAPYKTWTRDSIWPGQAPMGRNLPVLGWWISLICTFLFGCSHCRPKLAFYRGRMGPQKGQKCRNPPKMRETIYGRCSCWGKTRGPQGYPKRCNNANERGAGQ